MCRCARSPGSMPIHIVDMKKVIGNQYTPATASLYCLRHQKEKLRYITQQERVANSPPEAKAAKHVSPNGPGNIF